MSSKDNDNKTILITGAASGIGLAFAEHYRRQNPLTQLVLLDQNITPIDDTLSGSHEGRLGDVAAGRRIQDASTSQDDYPKQRIIKQQCDLSNPDSIRSLVGYFFNEKGIRHFDCVICSAGIRGLVKAVETAKPNDVAAAETLDIMDTATMMKTYEINTIGTFTLLQSLQQYGLLSMDSQGSTSKVIVMTSRMGSMSYNTGGGGYAYRASKAALNAIIKSMSIDVPQTIFCLMHPGRVETGLTACKEEGAIDVEEALDDMLKVIEQLEQRDSGRFMDRFGKDIGW